MRKKSPPSLLWAISILALTALVFWFQFGKGSASGEEGNSVQETSQTQEYLNLKMEAENLYQEGSYTLSHQKYLIADSMPLFPEDSLWVDFRVADTLWRSMAGSKSSDPSEFDQARQELEQILKDLEVQEPHTLVWAMVQESLGDFWWTRRDVQNWDKAWEHYEKALNWWGKSENIESAREQYISIVWKIFESNENREGIRYYLYQIPIEIVENVLKISEDPRVRAKAHYILARMIQMKGRSPVDFQRIIKEFEAALKDGNNSDWYDDALYQLANQLTLRGEIKFKENGQWYMKPDFVRALSLLQTLVREFKKGESRYYDLANNQIKEITSPHIHINLNNTFLPDSIIRYDLYWRNVSKIKFSLYQVNLLNDLNFTHTKDRVDWVQLLDLQSAPLIKSWEKDGENLGNYERRRETIEETEILPVGAYVIEAEGEGVKARELILITDVSLVLNVSKKEATVYFCDAVTGAPIKNADVKLWQLKKEKDQWQWKNFYGKTNKEGMVFFKGMEKFNSNELLVTAAIDIQQAYTTIWTYFYRSRNDAWNIYAFTDRPAYRPGETVKWKFVGRKYNGSIYSTPSQEKITYYIKDVKGNTLKEEKVQLNAFGSTWGSMKLTEAMPLGEYRVDFSAEDEDGTWETIGSASLFRLEEYKLPEFKIQVNIPKEKGKPKVFQLGDKVEVEIQADYFFGGPVSDARVEAIVYKKSFNHQWFSSREFPWYYRGQKSPSWNTGGAKEIKREILKTDPTGKATLGFETSHRSSWDLEYMIEVRVTDSSRREIIGREKVRVTHHEYYVYPRPLHTLYRPLDRAEVRFKTVDANDNPVQAEGQVYVKRKEWIEVWTDPNGKDVQGKELKRLREAFPAFPPNGDPRWKAKYQEYREEEIFTTKLKTDLQGEGSISFTPEREGFYEVLWTSQDKNGRPIISKTEVWVADQKTTDIGYRQEKIEIILDQDAIKPGQSVPIMLVTPTPDHYVLFSIEGDSIYSQKLIHIPGTVKLLEVPIEEKHSPNIYLSAVSVKGGQLFYNSKEIIIPPVQNFLNVEVQNDRDEYQPQEEGKLTIFIKDHKGNPVSAEVGMGVVDQAIYYIQEDYAMDPRQFFYGRKRGDSVRISSTMTNRRYVHLEENQESVPKIPGQKGGLKQLSKKRGELKSIGRFSDASAMEPELAEISGIDFMTVSSPKLILHKHQEGSVVKVRSDFRSTAFWQPDLMTGKDGKATVNVKFPDSLTQWQAVARVASQGNQFGYGTQTMRTKKPLMVRLQGPRFFVVGDRTTVSAIINNNTDRAISVLSTLRTEGVEVSGVLVNGTPESKGNDQIKIPPQGESRVDWVVSAKSPGNARLKVVAKGKNFSDAMEKTFLVHEHGIEKFISHSEKITENETEIPFEIPKERKPESTTMAIQVTPSLAVTVLDALPYLIHYPYGCTEQTMSRFLPAAITAKTLKETGLQWNDILDRIFKGKPLAHSRTPHSEELEDFGALDKVIDQGVNRLYDFQHPDGGWGWWKDGESDHYMSAYVVWGLTLAREAGIKIKDNALSTGTHYLDKEIIEQENRYDLQSWMLHALTAYRASGKTKVFTQHEEKAFENLWRHRDSLNAFTRALLALSAHHMDKREKAEILIRNLENGVKIDASPHQSNIHHKESTTGRNSIATAHWGEDGIYWRWSEGGVEATSFALQALLAIDPTHHLIEPVTHWLIKNRRGAQWSNTRDTAITVLALNDYIRSKGELQAEVQYDLLFNEKLITTQKIGPKNVLETPSHFKIDPKLIKDKKNIIQIRKRGENPPLYISVQSVFFSLEEPIGPSGNEIFVDRQYYRLVPQRTLLHGYTYQKHLLKDGDQVRSGERIETVMTINAKNNYEYLVFEDLKPAGFEAVEIRSGAPLYTKELKSDVSKPRTGTAQDYTQRQRWIYQELRDRKIALFIDKLPEGLWEIRYELRAEVPGQFHALPVLGYAMYVPEIRANGKEIRLHVTESP